MLPGYDEGLPPGSLLAGYFLPSLTVSLTFAPCLRCLPGLGFCATTRPFFRPEATCLTLPALQERALRARFAAASVLPVTLGTTQFFSANFAVTERASSALILHLDLPLHAPDQPLNDEPFEAVALRVTDVPYAKRCEHVLPQLIPAGVLLTLPEPFPDLCTVTVCAGGFVYVNEPCAGGAWVASLSTVSSVTGTVPTGPGGAVTVTVSVDPQSSSASAFVKSSATASPKETFVTQPRFSPVIVTSVPPSAEPELGLIESIFGSPGG